jgi:Asp-tRNA(Asn)/Glu-tRNA(Gln) amidotransferase A subunit family amidase
MTDTRDLAYLSAAEALGRFRRRDLSPVEVMEAVIARAEATEPVINAFTDTYFDRALEQAAAAAGAYAAGTARPLEGLPVAVKDEDDIAGQRTTNGSLLFADHVADETGPAAARILEAGGIVHARSAAPEFSMTIVTWSLLHGITRNPWNPVLTPGGSSGGSGAALAAGSAALASGSDIGGSIRIPASMNGVVGFKAPFGRVPEPWPWNREPFLSSGPLGRTVADTALFQNVLSGPLPGNLWSLPRVEVPARPAGVDGLRIALSPDLGYFDVAADVAAAIDGAAGRLRSLGARVDPVRLDWDERLLEVAEEHLTFLMGAILRRELTEGWEDRVTPYAREFFERPPVTVERWIDGWAFLDETYRELEAKTFAAGYDALICPTLTTTAVPAGWGHPGEGPAVPLIEALAVAMTYPFNALGRLPVLDVPVGISPSTGVPIGMQIVGPPEADPVPFRVGAALEAADGPLFDRARPDLP